MKKKLLATTIATILMVTQVFAIDLYVDGRKLDPAVNPVQVEGRTLVPLRAIFEAIGADVSWDDATKSATASKEDTTINISIGNTTAYVNGAAQTLDVPAQIINGSTMVPVRFVSESLNAKVDWEQSTETVYVSTIETELTPLKNENEVSVPTNSNKTDSSAQTSSEATSVTVEPSQSNVGKTVYVTSTGKKYHYSGSCNGGTYYASTLDKAQSLGLKPCNKCVN